MNRREANKEDRYEGYYRHDRVRGKYDAVYDDLLPLSCPEPRL